MNEFDRDYIVKKWLENLRSGKFRQGKDFLNYNGKFCCLGVLCETVIEHYPDFLVKKVQDFDKIAYHVNEKYCVNENENGYEIDSIQYLPFDLVKFMKLEDDTGTFRVNEIMNLPDEHVYQNQCSLAQLNDEVGMNFNEIADFIEEHKADVFSA